MANSAENRINLGVLQQNDPYITDILVTAHQVALYTFNPAKKEWEKTEIEGTLFAYSRAASPNYGFMILNRLGRNNLVEPIIAGIEFQPQTPFLLYRNKAGAIFGIWFYDQAECNHVTQLMMNLANVAIDKAAAAANRNRTVSEGTALTQAPQQIQPLLPPQPQQSSNGHQNPAPPVTNNNPLDIMQMLTRASQKHDSKQTEPKSMTDSPAVTTSGTAPLVRPLALRPAVDVVRPLVASSAPVLPPPVATVSTSSPLSKPVAGSVAMPTAGAGARPVEVKPISLDVLFRSASIQTPAKPAVAGASGEGEAVPPMVKRLLSLNDGSAALPATRREASPKQAQSPNRRSYGRQVSESVAVDHTPTHGHANIRLWDDRDGPSEVKVAVGQPVSLATLLPAAVGPAAGAVPSQPQPGNAVLRRSATDTDVYVSSDDSGKSSALSAGDPGLVLMTPAHLLASSAAAARQRQESVSSISPQPPQLDKLLLPPADFLFAARPVVIASPAVAPAGIMPGGPVILTPGIHPHAPPPSFTPARASTVTLDRVQLQTALIDLLKSDDEFLTTIHNAYLRRCWAESNLNK